MPRSSRFSVALHVLTHLVETPEPQTSEQLATCVRTNPVVVRRTMAGLRQAGYVRSERGHGGGWSLACDPAAVTLLDVHRAVGGPTLFAIGNESDNPQCLVEQSVNAALAESLRAAEAMLLNRLQAVTLAALAEDFDARWAACVAPAEAAPGQVEP